MDVKISILYLSYNEKFYHTASSSSAPLSLPCGHRLWTSSSSAYVRVHATHQGTAHGQSANWKPVFVKETEKLGITVKSAIENFFMAGLLTILTVVIFDKEEGRSKLWSIFISIGMTVQELKVSRTFTPGENLSCRCARNASSHLGFSNHPGQKDR